MVPNIYRQIDSPFFISHPSSHPTSLPGVQVMSVDILPTQIPQDASSHFSKALMPYLRTLIRQYQGALHSHEHERVEALERATIAQQGELKSVHRWLTTPLREFRQKEKQATESAPLPLVTIAEDPIQDKVKLSGTASKRKVLMLGSGMVARPAVEELSKRTDVRLVVGECSFKVRCNISLCLFLFCWLASNNVLEAPFAREDFEDVVFKQVDLSNLTAVDSLVRDADVVVRSNYDPYAVLSCA